MYKIASLSTEIIKKIKRINKYKFYKNEKTEN